MFLSQVQHTPGLHLIGVADLDPARAHKACRTVGWPDERCRAAGLVLAPTLELLDELHLGSIQLLISTVPEVGANRLLIQKVRKINKKAVIMATAERFKDALRLYAAGSDYVIMPHMIGGEHVSQLLRESKRDFASLKRRKQEHLAEIKAREQLGKTNIKMNIFNKGIINKEITKNKGLNKLINKGFTK